MSLFVGSVVHEKNRPEVLGQVVASGKRGFWEVEWEGGKISTHHEYTLTDFGEKVHKAEHWSKVLRQRLDAFMDGGKP